MKKKKRAGGLPLIFAIVLFALSMIASTSVIKALYPLKYTELIEKYSADSGIDKNLLYAIINTESSFDPDARSDVGALGLMQIMPETLDWIEMKTGENIEFEELSDAETCVRCGTFLLKYLLDEFGNTDTAVAAYHAGRGVVNSWLSDERYSDDGKTLRKIPYADTAHYVNKIERTVKIYKNLYS